MTKRKKPEGNDLDRDQSVPIPIQTFLWRQTSPFIRPKLGKLCEASCVSFERVVVQNILHGLSPSLCEAVESVSRWRVVRAAFPHILHCCAAMLQAREKATITAAAATTTTTSETQPSKPDLQSPRSKELQSSAARPPASETRPKFSASEVKLLYALHWVILDAAAECEDAENETRQQRSPAAGEQTSSVSYLLSLDDIQLFVFLLAPLFDTMEESDFQTLKLENGLRLWEPLWSYSQPDVPCFTIPAKHRRTILKAQRSTHARVNFNMANIYVGKGTSTDDIYCGGDAEEVRVGSEAGAAGEDDERSGEGSEKEGTCVQSLLHAPLAHMSDICALSITETTVSADRSTTTCETCKQSVPGTSADQSTCQCDGNTRRSSSVSSESRSLGLPGVESQRLDAAITAFARAYPNLDVLSASCFDVAVLRCLFCAQWPESGVHWALRYVHRRLLEISSERQNAGSLQQRQRSFSLPASEFPTSAPGVGLAPCLEEPASMGSEGDIIRRQPAFKRQRGAGDVDGGFTDDQDSVLGRLIENDEESLVDEDDLDDSSSDVARKPFRCTVNVVDVRRARNLVHHQNADDDDDSSGSGKHLKKPIITITSDTPAASPASRSPVLTRARDRRDSQMSTLSKVLPSPGRSHSTSPTNAGLPRSMTDSTINYGAGGCGEDATEELAGSACYVTADGQMDYRVILKSAHAVSSRFCSLRVCTVLLNILNCLLDIGAVEPERPLTSDEKSEDSSSGPKFQRLTEDEKKRELERSKMWLAGDEDSSTFAVALETVFRMYQSLGCPHGCRDGIKGAQADDVRTQSRSFLQRLSNLDKTQFSRYIQRSFLAQPLQSVMDQLHALIGFCAEPLILQSGPRKSLLEQLSRTGYGHNFGEQAGGGPSVQGQLIVQILKPLLDKCVSTRKELQAHENISLYCDVRQLLTYVKEVHGGTFRRVALAALIDSLKRPPHTASTNAAQATKISRRDLSFTSDSGDERETRTNDAGANKTRKLLFKKKVVKHILPGHGVAATSDSELADESTSVGGLHGRLSPRVSLAIAADDDTALVPKQRKSSKLNIAWHRSTKSDHEDEGSSDNVPLSLSSRVGESRSHEALPRGTGTGTAASTVLKQKRMSFKTAGQATLGFLSARRRLEDGLKCFSKRRQSRRADSLHGDLDSLSRAVRDLNLSSSGMSSGAGKEQPAAAVLREKKLVNSYIVKSGMLRFNFMLDCCNPGTLPDAHLIAALLDLEAPVVARAAMLLECAHLVSRCNHGDWPRWMKMPGGVPHSRSQPTGYRRNLLLQRTSGRLFHQWAEALGNHLSDILGDEVADMAAIVDQVKDESRRKELRSHDEKEDYLDEATVNYTGSDCPYSLKMIACHLLLEITSFLRETYQHMPRSRTSRQSGVGLEAATSWADKQTGGGGSSRRWSSVLGSPGQSERSNSRSSQGESHVQGLDFEGLDFEGPNL